VKRSFAFAAFSTLQQVFFLRRGEYTSADHHPWRREPLSSAS